MNDPMSSPRSTNRHNHAIVVGGSLAGLLTARILTDHFDQITLIERDRFPAQPEPRQGVHQAHHVHVLLMRGLMILEELFPGLTDELAAAGAPPLNLTNEVAWLTPAGWGVRFPTPARVFSFTRPLLDWHIHRRLAASSQIRFLDDCNVTSLLPNADNTGIVGVQWHPRHQPHEKRRLFADFVVDAGGRGSRAPQWLEALGYQPAEETLVNGHMGYASRLYRPPSTTQADWQGLYIQTAPPKDPRGGLIFPVEGNRWMVTLVGGDGEYPPTDEAGFLDFARRLRTSKLYDALRDAQPLTPIVGHRGTENRLRHYEKLPRQPDGFVVLGDAACAFNPVYGQGMSNAARSAQLLNQCLHEQRGRASRNDFAGLARRFQRQLAQINAEPWMLATGEDYRYRRTEGVPPSWTTQLMHRYMDQVVQLSTKHPGVRLALIRVFNMLESPTTLFHPRILTKVIQQRFENPNGSPENSLQPILNTGDIRAA